MLGISLQLAALYNKVEVDNKVEVALKRLTDPLIMMNKIKMRQNCLELFEIMKLYGQKMSLRAFAHLYFAWKSVNFDVQVVYD